MVKIDNLNNQSQNNQSANQNNQTQSKPNSGLLTIIGQLLPFAPMAFEQFTGQKVPQMTGTIAEMQMALINIQSGLQTIVNNQNQLVNRIQQLETNANNQLSNLTQQFNSLRLTHTREREKKEIAYNNPPLEQNQEY
jgi:hypothetical protein